MNPITWHDVRLSLHILAATVWVGGQLTLAGLVPVLRRSFPDAARPVARRFAVLAWSSFAVLVATGAWNVAAGWREMDRRDRRTLEVKLVLVVVSAAAALLHQRARSAAGLAVFGGISALAAVLVVFAGVLLAG